MGGGVDLHQRRSVRGRSKGFGLGEERVRRRRGLDEQLREAAIIRQAQHGRVASQWSSGISCAYEEVGICDKLLEGFVGGVNSKQ
jgi:hypothetical protein